MSAPELRRPVLLEHIGAAGMDVTVEADPTECAALAARMQVPAVHALTCSFHLVRERGDRVTALGHLRARITQACIVSMEEFQTDLEEVFRVTFVPAGEETDVIDPEADDDLPYEGNAIDVGEAAAEQLGLAIDPYPRMPGAALPEGEADVESAPQPFAALRALRKLN